MNLFKILPRCYLHLFLLAFVITLVLQPIRFAAAHMCPFCAALNPTFAARMDTHDVVVVAKLLEVPPPSDDLDAPFPKAKLEIVEVIKGESLVAPGMTFRTQLVGNYPIGQKFLVMGVDPPQLAWTTPMKATDRVFKYLSDIRTLPASGPQRLVYFQDYLEDKDSLLSFDAYDEFAGASYQDLIDMKDSMPHDKLVKWIRDPNTIASNRRLYFTMLGVCGTDDDVRMLEEFIRSDDRQQQTGLDALLACYLTLAGEAGVDLVEQTFLADLEVDFVDARAAVSALRFHGTEVDLIPKERIVTAIRRVLDRPKMADLVIADLARWEDWSVMDRLVQMFKESDEETNWLRVPVITYLRACPKPEAKQYIEELRKLDPDSVRRADFFLEGFEDDEDEAGDEAIEDFDSEEPETPAAATPAESPNKSESSDSPQPTNSQSTVPSDVKDKEHLVRKVPVQNANTKSLIEIPHQAETEVFVSSPLTGKFVADSALANRTVPLANAESTTSISETAPVATINPTGSTWMIVFVPMAVSVVIFLLLWSVINGWFERLIF